MEQNLIHKTLSQPDKIACLNAWLSEKSFASQREFGRYVCNTYDFKDSMDQPQITSTIVALKKLETKGLLVLPASVGAGGFHGPRLSDQPVEQKKNIPTKLSGLGPVEIILVKNKQNREIWNRMIDDEHPQGTTTFAGRQLRYLFYSSQYGYLGAVGFAAAAIATADREAWIGWSAEQKQNHLHRIIGMSRFLIRPHVRCNRLASMLLGPVLRRLKRDFYDRYQDHLWLVESFCEPQYRGTCLLAANFIKVGYTKGRGRQDTKHEQKLSKKAIFIYELFPGWRKKLQGLQPRAPQKILGLGEGLEPDKWVLQEFGGAPLGHIRSSERLVKSVSILSSYPGEPISRQDQPDNAAIRGFYRFMEKPAESEVTAANILKPHLDRTIQRMRGQKVTLAIMDGSTLNFNTRPACENLQVIGSNQKGAERVRSD